MSKKVLPNKDEMQEFIDTMVESHHCQVITKREAIELIETIPKSESLSWYKRSQTGIECCLKYQPKASPVMVIAWTTYVAGNQTVRTSDAAWVIIVDSATKQPLLFSFPMHRTKNFLTTFRKYIAAFIELVDTWPKPCSTCSTPLTIKQVPGVLLGKTFACPQGHYVRGWIYQNISETHRKFLESRYRAYDRYRKHEIEQGRVSVPRVFIRAGTLKPKRKKNKSVPQKNVETSDEFSQENPTTEAFPFNDTQYDAYDQ